MFDLVIRNGRIVDGTGAPGFLGDVAIEDGRIVAAGSICDAGKTEIDLDVSDGVFVLPMDNATVRFVTCSDGRPEGLGGIDIETNDRAAILEAAAARGCVSGDKQVTLCGMRMNLV